MCGLSALKKPNPAISLFLIIAAGYCVLAGVLGVLVWACFAAAANADRRSGAGRPAIAVAETRHANGRPPSPGEPSRHATPLRQPVGSALGAPDPLLALTRDLDMELALLTEVVDNREEVVRAAGAWPGVDLTALPGSSLALGDTFCERLLEGTLPPYVGDVDGDPTTADLALARTFGVKAWIGARVNTGGPHLYVLCCLARETRPTLDQRHVRALNAMAASFAQKLETSALKT